MPTRSRQRVSMTPVSAGPRCDVAPRGCARARGRGWRLALLVLVAPLAIAVSILLGLLRAPEPVQAQDRVVLRGNYYREESTRVLQPLVTYTKQLPDERLTVGTEYLLDSITSASIGAGALALGGDRLFTETRHEVSAFVNTKQRDYSIGGFVRYSTETDYESRGVGANASLELRDHTITLSTAYSYLNDSVYRIVGVANGRGLRVPWRSQVLNADGDFVDGDTKVHQQHNVSVGYAQILTPILLLSVGMEGAISTGPQENPYRFVRDGNPEIHPLLRRRFAPSASLNIGLPRARMAFEPHYRFYADDWGIISHMVEARIHVRPVRNLKLRARYRYYAQGAANFFQADGSYASTDRYRTADPKMGAFWSHTPGIEVTWYLDSIAHYRGLNWLRGGYLSATYDHRFVSESYRFGNARIGALTASFAF